MSSYRPCVAMLIIHQGRTLLFERKDLPNNWQFPQGGIESNETPEQAMKRELEEEIGISAVRIIATTKDFLYYRIPPQYQRSRQKYIGQKQKWFLLAMNEPLSSIKLDETREFSNWARVSYWHPLTQIVSFKQEVYRQALVELLPASLKAGI